MKRWASRLLRLPAEGLVAVVRAYQFTVSPWIKPTCRFQPTCSHYMVGALRKYGLVRGTLRGLWRIVRCNPFSAGGYDPP